MKQRSLLVVLTAAISLFAVVTSATALVSSAPATAQTPQHAMLTHEKRLKLSGDAGARKLLAHIDVVEAKREEWERGVILALTCDEVGGVGSLDNAGKPIIHSIQAGEKIYQTFHLEVTNSGGHSSVPRPDNAITQLADALSRIGKFQFPFALSTTTRTYFERRAALEPAAVAADMRAILQTPPDEAALTRLWNVNPYFNAAVRTTCTNTMVDAGHAENALPQRAMATVNCRILPGEKVADVQATLARVIADDKIKITTTVKATESPLPPLTLELMSAVEAVTNELWPGIPIIPQVSSGATDGRFLNSAGIWTYGITGVFHYTGGSNAHGLNEWLPVKSLYEAHEFQYRLGKRLGG